MFSPATALISTILSPGALMSFKRAVLATANSMLNVVNLHALPLYEYRNMKTTYRGPTWAPPPLPHDAIEYLQWSNPDLLSLENRYVNHPASSHTQWNREGLKAAIDLKNFRGDNHYVYQTRYSPTAATYYVTAYYVRDTDKLGLFGKLKEDGFFGAYTLSFDSDYLISRDLLDSINQANVIAKLLNLSREDPVRILDIGAGYGRLAHRLVEGLPNACVTCTDAVPLSTFISDYYLKFRHASARATVVPLDRAESALAGQQFDLVTNIHSFSECKLSAIAWWLDLVQRINCKKLLIVPNAVDRFLSTEADGAHVDFSHLFAERGWRLTHSEPIYAASHVARESGLYPNFRFNIFERP
jgi:SAM-dependent methyltransferase